MTAIDAARNLLQFIMAELSTQHTDSSHCSDLLFEAILMLGQRLAVMEQNLTEIKDILVGQRIEKDWYSTGELAEAMGKSRYTIQERWCNDGRIECQKDPNSGKWRIPGHEYRRLVNGGALKPKQRAARR